MGNCMSDSNKNKQRSSHTLHDIIKSKECVWELSRSSMVTAMKAGNITANALDRKPLLCNYIVLNVNQYHVTKIKMCKLNHRVV